MGWGGVAAGAQVVSGLYGAYSSKKQANAEAQALQEQLQFQQKVEAINSKVTEFQVRDALRRGDEEVAAHQVETRKLIGTQTAAFAAQGIDVSSGIAALVPQATAELSAMDEMKIKTNAWREALGYRTEGLNASLQGQINTVTTENRIRNTLAAGGLNAVASGLGGISRGIDTYASFRKKG